MERIIFFDLRLRLRRKKKVERLKSKHPNGLDLFAKLIELVTEQEGVNITYELTEAK